DDATLLHRYCYRNGIACGFIHPEDDLSRLKALYVPHWVMWKQEWNAAVEAFVRSGGTLILSALTGTRDENNHIVREQAPGRDLSALSGVKVAEFGRLVPQGGAGLFPLFRQAATGAHVPPAPLPASSAERKYHFTFGNRQFEAAHLYELLEVEPDTEVLGAWSSRFCAGQPAITSRQLGKGRVVYVGTYLTHELAEAIAEGVLTRAGVAPLLPELPDGVEVSIREAEDRQLMFVQNTTEVPVAVPGVPQGLDLLTGRPTAGPMQLEAYGSAVILLS
ncbi:MAG: beta-galactosidase, partial [Mesorhizobium sp.]